jgi:hypothetical protein
MIKKKSYYKPIHYTPEQLHKRELNLQSQLLFGNFLDTDIVTSLVNLFKDNRNYTTPKIVKYIEDERKLQGLDNRNVKVESEIYNIITNSIDKKDSSRKGATLLLKIIKNNKEFIHLTIHLVPTTINSDKDGLIHIFKDVYKTKGDTNKTKSVPSRETNKLYALISVKQPDGKPNSLEFSIDKQYYKTNVPTIINSDKIDDEINKEMDVILTVLNSLFDEENIEFYIGGKDKLREINQTTNKVLNNINMHSLLTTRKNKGIKTILGRNTLESSINLKPIIHIPKKNKQTRKKYRNFRT